MKFSLFILSTPSKLKSKTCYEKKNIEFLKENTILVFFYVVVNNLNNIDMENLLFLLEY